MPGWGSAAGRTPSPRCILGWKFWLSKCGRWPGVGLSLILFNFLSKRWLFETIWCNSCKFSCGECFCFLLRHKSFQFKCSQLVDKSHYIHFLHLWPPSPEDGPSWCKQRPTAKSTSATSALFSDTSAPKTSSLGVGCGKAAGNCLNCARFRHPCPLFWHLVAFTRLSECCYWFYKIENKFTYNESVNIKSNLLWNTITSENMEVSGHRWCRMHIHNPHTHHPKVFTRSNRGHLRCSCEFPEPKHLLAVGRRMRMWSWRCWWWAAGITHSSFPFLSLW